MKNEWTTRLQTPLMWKNWMNDDRLNRENGVALSHRLAEGVVSLLYKLCGQCHFPCSKAHVISNDRED